MNENDQEVAVAVFTDRRHARLAVEELCRNGFTHEQIGFVIPEERQLIDPPPLDQHATKAEQGAMTGAATGGSIGTLVGAALASGFIPGVGPILAGGLLVGVAAGALTGLAGGGLLGALIGLSIPEERAKGHEREFHSGRTLVTVRAGDRHEEAVAILKMVEAMPDALHLYPGARAAHLSQKSGPGPGSGSVFVGE